MPGHWQGSGGEMLYLLLWQRPAETMNPYLSQEISRWISLSSPTPFLLPLHLPPHSSVISPPLSLNLRLLLPPISLLFAPGYIHIATEATHSRHFFPPDQCFSNFSRHPLQSLLEHSCWMLSFVSRVLIGKSLLGHEMYISNKAPQNAGAMWSPLRTTVLDYVCPCWASYGCSIPSCFDSRWLN